MVRKAFEGFGDSFRPKTVAASSAGSSQSKPAKDISVINDYVKQISLGMDKEDLTAVDVGVVSNIKERRQKITAKLILEPLIQKMTGDRKRSTIACLTYKLVESEWPSNVFNELKNLMGGVADNWESTPDREYIQTLNASLNNLGRFYPDLSHLSWCLRDIHTQISGVEQLVQTYGGAITQSEAEEIIGMDNSIKVINSREAIEKTSKNYRDLSKADRDRIDNDYADQRGAVTTNTLYDIIFRVNLTSIPGDESRALNDKVISLRKSESAEAAVNAAKRSVLVDFKRRCIAKYRKDVDGYRPPSPKK